MKRILYLSAHLGHLGLSVEVRVLETCRIKVIYEMTQKDTIAQSNCQNLYLRVGPIRLVVGRDDLALDQPGYTVTPQVISHLLAESIAGMNNNRGSQKGIMVYVSLPSQQPVSPSISLALNVRLVYAPLHIGTGHRRWFINELVHFFCLYRDFDKVCCQR